MQTQERKCAETFIWKSRPAIGYLTAKQMRRSIDNVPVLRNFPREPTLDFGEPVVRSKYVQGKPPYWEEAVPANHPRSRPRRLAIIFGCEARASRRKL